MDGVYRMNLVRGWFLAGVALLAGCSGRFDSTFARRAETRRETEALRHNFARVVEASGRAVMADTDPASIEFAREARDATATVERDARALKTHLTELALTVESQRLEEFVQKFDTYRALNQTVLELAVENTNLKAQRLAFGEGREAADAFASALEALVLAAPLAEKAEVETSALRAMLAVREVQALEPVHIAEAEDAAMTRMEATMTARIGDARSALEALANVSQGQTTLATARAAMDRFGAMHTRIVSLSRRNTNVRSLALSLGESRAQAEACEASLRSLAEALAHEGTNATR